jgi:hypothetical protein
MTKEIEGSIQIILSVEFCQINHNNETFYQGLSFNSFTVFLMQMDFFFVTLMQWILITHQDHVWNEKLSWLIQMILVFAGGTILVQ